MEKIVNIPVKNDYDFYRIYLEIIDAFKHLRDREKDVLACFLSLHSKMKRDRLSDDIRRKLLFDYDTKQDMKNKLGIKEDNFNTIISSLRNKGVLTPDDDIHEAYHIDLEYPFTLSFKFNAL